MKKNQILSLFVSAFMFSCSVFSPLNISEVSAAEKSKAITASVPTADSKVPEKDEKAETTSVTEKKEIPEINLKVSNLCPFQVTDKDYTYLWKSTFEDAYYIFLPSQANLKNLTLTYTPEKNEKLYLNGVEVISGRNTSLLSTDDEFTVKIGNEKIDAKLKVMQSDLDTMFMKTASGSISKLDKNKKLVETGSLLIMDKKGVIEYDGNIESLTSHGNSSWDYSKKKPYNLKLEEKTNLFKMGKAKKWVLLGNYLDHSMIRNAVTFDMSKAADPEYGIDYHYAELYVDGEYRGPYMITERVEINKNRVDITNLEKETEKMNDQPLKSYPRKVVNAEKPNEYIENSYKYFDIPNEPDDHTGGFLLEFQLYGRYKTDKTQSGFVSKRGQAIKLRSPEYATQKQTKYIKNFFQDFEDAVYSASGYNKKGKHYSDYIDVDSLLKTYLVNEISENVDSTQASFFLWKDSDITGDGKFHFSPVWDYDLSYANYRKNIKNTEGKGGYSLNPNTLYAAYFPISGYDSDLTDEKDSGRPTEGINFVGKLYTRPEITHRIAELYFEYFDDYIVALTDNSNGKKPGIDKYRKVLEISGEMNNARWHMYGGKPYKEIGPENGNSYTECVEYLRNFISKRQQFLSKEWKPWISYDKAVKGDANYDLKFNAGDVIELQAYLNFSDNIKSWTGADFDQNGSVDLFDLIKMKRSLLKTKTKSK